MALAGLAIGGLRIGTKSQQDVQPTALPQPEIPARIRASEIVGRWGYAAFHDQKDRTRTEANARGQCKQPYVIGQGPTGGVMMYLAELLATRGICASRAAPPARIISVRPARRRGPQDREIVSFDGRVMLLKFVDPEIDGRYGTGIYVRCASRAR